MQDKCSINEFLKAIQKEFGQVEYKATSKDGQTFKSKGWDHAQVEFNKRQFSRVSRETNKS